MGTKLAMNFEFNENTFLNELHIEAPQEFVECVSLDSNIKNIIFGPQYIFRGVSNASYELIPSARRDGVELSSLSFPSEADDFNARNLVGQIAKEYLIIKKIMKLRINPALKFLTHHY